MQLAADRARLRSARREDLPNLEVWYDDALATAHAETSLEERFADVDSDTAGLLIIETEQEPESLGLVHYRLVHPGDGWLMTRFLAVKNGRRGFGYGSEAIRALEVWAEESHEITSFMAEVDPRNGLGLYFWLRLGYRPARADEVFWHAPGEGGIIAMVRTA